MNQGSSAVPSKLPHVTDAELAILRLLWDTGTQSARQIREVLYPAGTPSDQATVQKLLARLEEKGFVRRDRSSFAHMFTARVSRERLAGAELEALAEKLSEGSLVPFITHLAKRTRLTEEERREIRALLDR
jgi:predicted transcriptional regulator